MSTVKTKKEIDKLLIFERSYVYAISFVIAWFKSQLKLFFPCFTDYFRGVVLSCKFGGNFFQSPLIEWTIEPLTLGKA